MAVPSRDPLECPGLLPLFVEFTRENTTLAARRAFGERLLSVLQSHGYRCQCTHEAGDSPCETHDMPYLLGVLDE